MTPFMVKDPLVLIFEDEHGVQTHIYAPENYSYEHYGILLCDLIRHIAESFEVDEDDVFEWIERERRKPTTRIEGGRVN